MANEAVIEVEQAGEGDPLEFEVIVGAGNGETRHPAAMARDVCERLTIGPHAPPGITRTDSIPDHFQKLNF